MRLIAALLIITALASSVAFADDVKPLRMITVTGRAERHIAPDEAHVTVNVTALDMKLQTAKADHDQKLRKVMEIAKAAGIDEAQVKSQSSNVQPQYTYENNSRVFKGYRVATNLDITVMKIDAVGGLLEKLMAAGLETKSDPEWQGLTSVSYTISNPDTLRDEMMADAIKNAHDKAERMAVAAGANLGVVYQISEAGAPVFNPRPMPMMAVARGLGSAPEAAAPPPGEQELSSTVTVSYELRN